ncbi:unnamed protein product [Vitrella brassicaformis CCMP3155]|uniref:Uncharacterized protein n=2 Tax=Vitrella brassicaformis TaxID=1169539 RepID=A0A0G4FRD4_VITBC|nr:unnamed protein product [Vitrella brassicaformis CCMP3155]|eukprot:CEM16617.1 unnamed protein product [Vitrella brassicaformis CCMP3155]
MMGTPLGRVGHLSDPFRCPHCQLPINDDRLAEYVRRKEGFLHRTEEETTLRPTALPLYSPTFYQGMFKTGRTYGPVPPSFFRSPYDTHTWAVPKT